MKQFVFRWRHAWWKLILIRFILCSSAATGQMALSSSNINFGVVPVGSSSTLTVNISNNNKSNLSISQVSVTGSVFTFAGPNLPITLGPQQTIGLSVTFAPESGGAMAGSMSVVSGTPIGNSGKQRLNTTTIPLTGTGGTNAATAATPGYLAADPTSVGFGSVQVGGSQSLYLVLTNSGGSTLTLSQATVTGSGFVLSGFTAPETLAAGQSLTLNVVFSPLVAGSTSGTLSFVSDASDANLSVPLSATATSPGQLAVTPGSINFGTITVGTSQTQTGTLTASGASVTISSGSSNSSEFILSGLKLPLTISAGQSVSFSVTFSPQSSGTTSASVAFSSDASSPTVAEPVTGTGASTIQHSVSLSWSSSTSTVVGYNIYRSGTSGGPYSRVNSSLDSGASYVDSTVQSGQTYFYVTTAVDSTGAESGYSNQVSAIVPSP